MSLATLFNVPRTPNEIEYFLQANEALHYQVIAAVKAQLGVSLIILPLRPVAREDLAGFLTRHAVLHQETNDALKLGSNDLQITEFAGDEFANFIYLHGQEHRQWQITLGL
jgi:hypothetical protein